MTTILHQAHSHSLLETPIHCVSLYDCAIMVNPVCNVLLAVSPSLPLVLPLYQRLLRTQIPIYRYVETL